MERIQLGAVTSCLPDREAEEAVDLIASLGFDAIEFLVHDTLLPQAASPARRRDLRARCRDRNLAVAGLNGALPATGHRILVDDERERRTGIDALKRVIDLCADLGGKVVTVGSPGARNVPGGVPRDVWYPRAVAAFTEWVAYASAAGVGLALEIINRFEANWGRSIEEGQEFLGAVGRATVGLTIDTFHMNIEEGPFAAAIARGGQHIVHVHIADSNRQAIGRGNLDVETILEALTGAGYQGCVAVELFPEWYGIALEQPAEEALRCSHRHLLAALERVMLRSPGRR